MPSTARVASDWCWCPPTSTTSFPLAGQGVDFVSYLKTGDDMTFIESLNPRWTGALPATFVYDGAGRQQRFWEGKATFDTMLRHVLEVLASSGSSSDSGSAARH
jgi:hypothetical protein